MFYVFLNFLGIEVGGLQNKPAKSLLSDQLISSILIIANICVAIIGIQGAIVTNNSILLLLSCVLGALVGTIINLDEKFARLGVW